MAVALSFGLGREVPAGTPAWGARWIFPDDQLADRQSTAGNPDGVTALLAWLNGGANRKARAAARKMVEKPAKGQYRWRSNDSDTRVLFEDATGIVVGNPNKSYGYLYVAAWLKAAVPGNIPVSS